MIRTLRACCLFSGLLGACWNLAPELSSAQSSSEDRTLSTMWQHGLTESAVLVASARMRGVTDTEQQAKWSMRLMEAYAQAALQDPQKSDEYWRLAAGVPEEFAIAQPDHPRQPWLGWQAARCKLLEAQANLAYFLAAPANTNKREATLTLIRTVLRQAETLADDLQRRQPRAARQGFQDGAEAPAEELHKLAIDTALLECEALLVRVKLYPPASPDRVAAATEIDTRATTVLARSANDWLAQEQLQVAVAVAQLELGNLEIALKQLEQLAREASDPQVRVRAAVTAIEQLSQTGETSRGQPLLAYLDEASQQTGAGAQLGLARLQLELAEIARLPVEPRTARLNRLVSDSKQIGARYGDYWRNRAEALLVGALPNDNSNTNIASDLMLVEVRQLLASDREAEAIARLLQFRDNEATAGRGESAIRLASQAAALLQRQRLWAESVAALESVVFNFSKATNAAETHRLIIHAHLQALREDSGQPERITNYEAALQKQLTTWPDATASDEPEQWLMTWLAAQERHPELVNVLLARIAAATEVEPVRTTILHCIDSILKIADEPQRTLSFQRLREISERVQLPELRASLQAACLFVEAVASWPPELKASELTSATAQIRGSLNNEVDMQLAIAVQWLAAVRRRDLAAGKATSTAWQPALLPASIRTALTPAIVEAVDQLELEAQSRWLTELKLDAAWIADLQASNLPLDQAYALRLQGWMVDASAGLDGLSALSKRYPRDGQVQLQLAHALAASGPNRFVDSTRIARQVVANSAPASELNLAARWRLCRNLVLAGELAAAKQAAALFVASQPLPASIWKERFEQLAK